MKVLVEKYLKDNSQSLEKVLKKFVPVFKQIDLLKKATAKLDSSNITAVKDALTKLTGYYMEIVDILRKLEALKKNKRSAYYYNKKAEIEGDDKKFVSSPVEKESDLYVAEERRVIAAFQGKADSTLEGIRTCRALVQDNKSVKSIVEGGE